MRIFHGPNNITGAAGLLARGQRELGASAHSVCYPTRTFLYPSDSTLRPWVGSKVRMCLLAPWQFDCFQFYFSESLSGPHLVDVPWLKRLGKKVFFYFCGCDIRDSKKTIAEHKFSACKECWPMACSANREQALEAATRHADGAFVMTPDLLEFLPGSVWLPTPLDVAHLCGQADPAGECRPAGDGPIVIAHAPSNRMLKGTVYLERAVKGLQEAGHPVQLLLIEKVPNAEAMRLTARADIVVDQLLIGAYGHYSAEAMALGKPVVCYIRDDLRRFYPSDLPVLSADPETIGSVLLDLMGRRGEWAELGRRGREYVRRTHDYLAVARTLLDYHTHGVARAAG